MSKITAHMIVKNEDQWVWFAIMSTLPYVDEFFITDTGSTDNTLKIIQSIKSPKIRFQQKQAHSSSSITSIRQNQLNTTKTPWFWVIDGDEIYSDKLAKEIVTAVQSDKYEGIVVRRYDLLGDIYHRQSEKVGQYNLFGQKGHLVTRLVNINKIKGLHLAGDYPLEGYYDKDNISTRDRNPKKWYISSNSLYHAMYLIRSSFGSNITTMLNRNKFKIENGLPISGNPPEIFLQKRPSYVPDPLRKRPLWYEILALLITPMKKIKRMLL